MTQAAPGSPALQDAVSQLCCAVWAAKVEGREAVVAQTLPYLIIRALTSGEQRISRTNMQIAHLKNALTSGEEGVPAAQPTVSAACAKAHCWLTAAHGWERTMVFLDINTHSLCQAHKAVHAAV